MTKEMTIVINEDDESVLLEIFKRFKVKIKDIRLTADQQVIREKLHQKYVTTGEWDGMSLEDKEDAVLNEQIALYQTKPKVEMDKVLDYLKSKIANE
jgi:hypothetical protein